MNDIQNSKKTNGKARKPNKFADKGKDDFNCIICFNFIIEPVSLPCNHYFCFECIEEVIFHKQKCPMCRKDLAPNYKPQIDNKILKVIQKKFPILYSTNEKELKKRKTLEKDLTSISFLFGNLHEELETEKDNKHRWTLFIKPEKSEYDLRLFFKKVTYELHSSFGGGKRVLKHPYSKTYIGWGTFEIPITIQWKKWLNRPDVELKHLLCFQGQGIQNRIKIKILKKDLKKNYTKSRPPFVI